MFITTRITLILLQAGFVSFAGLVSPAVALDIKSVTDLPKPVVSPEEIKKAGVIRVIAESAPHQSRYNALEAARGMAMADILFIQAGGIVEGGRIHVSGTIRTFDCGSYYDESTGTGYSCMEAPAK